MLGVLYFYGSGVPQSYVRAYAWCELAEDNGNSDATLCRDASLEAMPNAEREQAFRLVIEWRERLSARR
jgi:TPR repeat protein